MNFRSGFCAVALAIAPLGLTPTGCQSGGGADMVSIPSGLRDSVGNYMDKYGNLNKLLGSVTDVGKAEESLPKLNSLIGSMDTDARAINNASREVKSDVKTAIAPQLADLNKGLDKNITRLLGNRQISSMLKPSLDRIPKLFL